MLAPDTVPRLVHTRRMTATEGVRLPRRSATQPAPTFSLLVFLAPLLSSVLMFTVFRSPYVLALAVTGPITAAITFWVQRRSWRSSLASAEALFTQQMVDAHTSLTTAHLRERADALEGAKQGWLLGLAPQPSRVTTTAGEDSTEHEELRIRARINPELPVVLKSRDEFARSRPDIQFEGTVASLLTAWHSAHRAALGVAADGESLGYRKDARGLTVLATPDTRLALGPIRPVLGEVRERRSRERAKLEAQRNQTREMLRAERLTSRRDALLAHVGTRASGDELVIDLVAEGPHTLIAGTTGSGKSVLLRQLVSQLSYTYSPRRLQLVLIDFKGGAGMRALAQLPHVIATLTDLTVKHTRRTVLGLSEEVLRRERLLAEFGVDDIVNLPTHIELARLVVVVDEFATLVTDHPELYHVFNDLGARGRSLGIHLVLATQRATGSVRDTLAANCSLRFALRLSNAQDSIATVGTAAAAELTKPGACIVSSTHRSGEHFQVQAEQSSRLAQTLHPATGFQQAVAPWMPELPELIPFESTQLQLAAQREREDDAVIALGLLDEPEFQRHRRITLQRDRFACVGVIGAAESGKSNLCHLVASQLEKTFGVTAAFPAPDAQSQWIVMSRLQAKLLEPVTGSQPSAWIFDDLDRTLAQLDAAHAQVVVETISQALRVRPQALWVVFTAQSATPAIRRLFTESTEAIALRQPTREEHLALGLDAKLFDPKAPAGRGLLEGKPFQAVRAPLTVTNQRAHAADLRAEAARLGCAQITLVTRSSRRWRTEPEVPQGSQSNVCVQIVTPEQAQRLQRSAQDDHFNRLWVFDDVSAAELASITGSFELEPAIDHRHSMLAWHIDSGYRVITRESCRLAVGAQTEQVQPAV